METLEIIGFGSPLDKASLSQTEISFTGGGAASGSHSGGTYIERITNDAREDEMEENMQAVCSSTSSFHHLGLDP